MFWLVIIVILHFTFIPFIQPFNAQEDTGIPFQRNFNSILRRDNKKKTYERRAYESVEEKSLS